MKYRFRPSLLATMLTLLLLVAFTKLGFWQWHKAEQKQALQVMFDARLREAPVGLPTKVEDVEAWRYRRIRVAGQYDTRYQILLDNQVNGEAAGYHVITPLKAEDGDVYVLVDRGWIPMGNRSTLPQMAAPQVKVEAVGFAWVPSSKFYELQAPPPVSEQWQPLWQNMDMERYTKAVPFPVLPFVVRLDADRNDSGFVRNWPRPAERIEMHISYAYQWFGFAVAMALIYLAVNLKKVENE